MKKSILLSLFIFLLAITSNSQHVDWKHIANSTTEAALATDEDGNVYTLYLMSRSLLFIDEINTGVPVMRAPMFWTGRNYMLTKVSPSGDVLWNRNILATASAPIHQISRNSVKVYLNDGNIYIGFNFRNIRHDDSLSIISPQESGDTIITYGFNGYNYGDYSSYLLKLDEQGYFGWGQMLTGTNNSLASGISKLAFLESGIQVNLSAPSKNNSTILKMSYDGNITDTISYDASPSMDGIGVIYDIAELNNSSSYLYLTKQDYIGTNSTGAIHKFDKNGNLVAEFSTSFVPNYRQLVPEAMTLDGKNNVYVVFNYSLYFGDTAKLLGNQFMKDHRMVIKLDSNLKAIWANPIILRRTGIEGIHYNPQITLSIAQNGLYVGLSSKTTKTDLYVNDVMISENRVSHLFHYNNKGEYQPSLANPPEYTYFNICSDRGKYEKIYFTGEVSDFIYIRSIKKEFPGQDRYVFGKIQAQYNLITGKFIADLNKNNKQDNDETTAGIVNLKLNNSTKFSKQDGTYAFAADSGSSLIKVFAPNYYDVEPDSNLFVFNGYDSVASFNFYLHPKLAVKDVDIQVVNKTSRTRLGRKNIYQITVKNRGTQVVSPTVRFVYDTTLIYESAGPTADSTHNNELFWNVNNLKPLQSKTFTVIAVVKLPPNAALGDTLCSFAEVIPVLGESIETSDSIPEDNRDTLYDIIIGAYDPNIKEVNKPALMDIKDVNGSFALDYTIHFQNTGNDTAFHVYLIDSLDTDLNIESIEVLSASHNYEMSISGNNTLRWDYYDILLVDSTTNEPGSHGFVKYRVWTKDNPKPDNVYENFADIYFDYNAPIRTNTVTTKLIDCDGMLGHTLSTPSEFCDGDYHQIELNYTGHGADSFKWVVNGVDFKGSTNLQIVPVAGQSETEVDLKVYHKFCGEKTFKEKITINALPNKPVVTANKVTELCQGTSAILRAENENDVVWSNQSTKKVLVTNKPGDYWYTATNTNGCSINSDTVQVIELTRPGKPFIDRVGIDSLRASTSATSYLWYRDNTLLDENTRIIKVDTTGSYRVQSFDGKCESETSDAYNHTFINVSKVAKTSIEVYPNPSNGVFAIKLNLDAGTNANITVVDLTGKVVYSNNAIATANGLELSIDIKDYPKGIYIIQVKTDNKTYTTKLIKE